MKTPLYPQSIIFDFNRTLYNPETNSLEPGAEEMILYFYNRGWKVYVVAKSGEGREEMIQRTPFAPYLRKVIVAPTKRVEDFRACADDAGMPLEDIVVVGDRVKSEIRIGKQLGMLTVWYRKGKFADEEPDSPMEEPDEIITDLCELKNFL